MARKDDTVRYTAEEIKAKITRGEDRTDWAKIDATTATGGRQRLSDAHEQRAASVRREPQAHDAMRGPRSRTTPRTQGRRAIVAEHRAR